MSLRKITVWLSRHYRPSLPALSFMRIAVALVVLADLLIRWPDMAAFCSDEGIWPREVARQLGSREGYWSLHMLSGSVYWQLTLFCLHLIAAVFLLTGYRTVFATVVTWALLVSLHNRNIYILQAGDDLLRMTLFFGIFLPWNACYSVDRARKHFVMPSSVFVYLAYLLLIASVYFFTVILKTSPEWWSEGSAIYYALSLEQLRLPYSGDWLYAHPSLMMVLTWLVLCLETAVPLLILWPGRKGRSRTAAFICILLLQSGIASTLYVGLFPFIGVASATGLLVFQNDTSVAASNYFSQQRLRTAISAFAAVVAALCLLINLQGVPQFSYEMRSFLRPPAHALRLDQFWGMFSPSVLKKDGWFVHQGVDASGKEWDLSTDRSTVSYSKPAHIVSLYSSDRWRKLAENLQNDNFTFLRPLYARYVIRKWNREHPEKPMQMLNLYFMEKMNAAGYQKPAINKILYCVSDGR